MKSLENENMKEIGNEATKHHTTVWRGSVEVLINVKLCQMSSVERSCLSRFFWLRHSDPQLHIMRRPVEMCVTFTTH